MAIMATIMMISIILIPLSGFAFDGTLLQTNIIFRHGDRAPVVPFKNDVHKPSEWPEGYGELTSIGVEQHIRLGKFLRSRYSGFINETYNSTEVYVHSSDYNRCLVSAYSNLAGLYSDTQPAWSAPYLRWQPVPVHSVPAQSDNEIAMSRPCKALDNYRNASFSTSSVQQIIRDYKSFFEMVTLQTGIDLMENGVRDAWMVRDTLYCEKMHNLSLPHWTSWRNVTCNNSPAIRCDNRTVFDILGDLEDLQFQIMFSLSEVHKFDGGPLLTSIAENFLNYTTSSWKVPRFYIYSGHDTTVAAVLSALGAFDGHSPRYAAAVFLELHKIDDKTVVRLLYKNITDDNNTFPLEISGCPSPCLLDIFKGIVQNLSVMNWDKECGNIQDDLIFGLTKEEVIVISVCLTILICMMLSALICYANRRRISDSYVRMD